MGEISALLQKFIDPRFLRGMEEVGKASVEEIQDEIGTAYPPASSPGQPPHLRTGNLRDGVTSTTETGTDEIVTTITSSRVQGNPAVPTYLEFGTSKMAPRPYMGPAKNRAPVLIPETLKRTIGVGS